MPLPNADGLCFLSGISFSNLDTSEIVEQALAYMQEEGDRQRPAYLATVNVDFLVKALFWRWACPHYPGLLPALRACRWAVADGMPIVWLSALLGCPLKERIAGADLVPALLERCQQTHKKVFLFGGQGDSAYKADEKLKERYPQLQVAGIYAPFIPDLGADLAEAAAIDAAAVDIINASGADLLLIALGNPKQEVWFRRVQKDLRVPLSIGVGGVFQFFSGSVLRAPMWMRTYGLEWLHRWIQEPKRLWKRYLLDGLKFCCLVTPLLIFHYVHKALWAIADSLFYEKSSALCAVPVHLFTTPSNKVSILRLPRVLCAASCALLDVCRDNLLASDICFVDFAAVRQVDAWGLGWLFGFWQEAEATGMHLRGFSMGFSMQSAAVLYGMADKLFPYTSSDLAQAYALEFQGKASFLCEQVMVCGDRAVITYFGECDDLQDYTPHLASVYLCGQKYAHCQLDVRYCVSLETAGIMFLLAAKKHVQAMGKTCVLTGISPGYMHLFQ